MTSEEPCDKEIKLTAAMYASRPGVLDHVRRTGRLPKEISMGGASIQARHLIAARGVDIVMTEAERIVYDAIIREGRLPWGRLILVPEFGSDGQGFRSGESDELKASED